MTGVTARLVGLEVPPNAARRVLRVTLISCRGLHDNVRSATLFGRYFGEIYLDIDAILTDTQVVSDATRER